MLSCVQMKVKDSTANRLLQKRRCALAVMAKAPLAGAVKTRLVPPLTPDEAAALSICFLRDTTANIAHIAATGDADGLVAYTPVGAEAAFDRLLPEGFKLLRQRGESLGDRLFNATEELLTRGYESVCLINSDSPTLPPAVLAMVVASLARPGDRVILGPSEDGGYYLIGLKRAHRCLFDRIAWSTADVLAHTIERAGEIGLDVELLPAWYDVDDAATLRRLCGELFSSNGPTNHAGLAGHRATCTRDYLAQLIEREGYERIWPEGAAHLGQYDERASRE